MAVTALKKTESIPNVSLRQIYRLGIFCVMYYSPIAQQTAQIIATEFKVTLFAILLLDSNRGLRIAYKVNGGSL